MSITQFQITKNTSRSTMKIAGIPIILNQKYNINLQSLIVIENDYGYPSEPLDNFKYKIIVDDVMSINEGTVIINIETDKTSLPETINLVKEIEVYSGSDARGDFDIVSICATNQGIGFRKTEYGVIYLPGVDDNPNVIRTENQCVGPNECSYIP